MPDDKEDKLKVVPIKSLGDGKNKFFPPGKRIRSVNYLSSSIGWDGRQISPCATHVFDTPATEAQLSEHMQTVVSRGGIMGRIGDARIFIPWPCALVSFDLVNGEV